jgi:two-component system phosphate regulon sensor histidine kinase PhoR
VSLRARIFLALIAVQLVLGGLLAARVERSQGEAIATRQSADRAREEHLLAELLGLGGEVPDYLQPRVQLVYGTAGTRIPDDSRLREPRHPDAEGLERRVLLHPDTERLEHSLSGLRRSLWGTWAGLMVLLGLASAGLSELLASPLRRAAAKAGYLGRTAEEALTEQARALATQREQAADASRRSQATLDALPDGVVVLNSSGRVEVLNELARRLLGVASPAGAADHPALARDGGIDLAGAQVEISRTAIPGGGTLVRLRDVTELRRLESVRQDFVSNVSHELRTPVSVIRTNIEALQGGALERPELAVGFVAAIGRNAERLGSLITDLLSLASLDGGERLDLEAVDAGRVAWRVRESLTRTAEGRGQLIALEIEPGTSVLADPGALEQVLTNLVENAIKYGPERGRIELRERTVGRGLRLEVHDSGPGVSAEHRGRVFERFYRIDKGRSRRMGGTGLGLSIVRHLAAAMGGEAGVTDSDLGGACFYIELRRG